jgi:hypothetical protein
MSVTASYTGQLTITEVMTGNVADVTAANNSIIHSSFNVSAAPTGTLYAGFVATLVAGAVTIDLTNLTGTNGITVNGNGLKVQAIILQAPAGNANPLTFKQGATNGYTGLGTNFLITLSASGHAVCNPSGGGNAISATNKTFDLSGTGSQTLNVGVLMG